MEVSRPVSRSLKTVKVCTILVIAAFGYILALSTGEVFDPFVSTPAPWFAMLLALLAPNWFVLHLLEAGKQTKGLTWAMAWGVIGSIALIAWAFSLPCNLAVPLAPPGPLLMLCVFVLTPLCFLIVGLAAELLSESGPPVGEQLRVTVIAVFIAVLGSGPATSQGFKAMPMYPNQWRNESSAAAAIVAIAMAEAEYSQSHDSSYSPTLRTVCPPGTPLRLSNPAERLDELFPGFTCGDAGTTANTFTRNGYFFIYTSGGKVGFTLRGDPILRGRTGVRSFFVDHKGVIHSNSTRQATPMDNPI